MARRSEALRRGPPAEFIQQIAQDEGPCVVVRAVAFLEVRHIEYGVLEDAGAIAHAHDVIEPQRRQIVGPAVERPPGKGRS